MRSFSLLVALFLSAAAAAQTLPPQGADATFDVATWNIENFGTGSGGDAQRAAVAEVIRQADVDLWALQEIADEVDFATLLQEIVDDGYRGILGPDPQFGNQRLAYIYNENVVTVVFTRTVLEGNEYAFAYRLPLEMQASVTVNGETQSLRLLNIHAKCCSDQTSYNRRTEAAEVLKEFTDEYIEDGRAVMVLGDFNDRLNVSISGGLSPYRPYRTDPDYTIATFDIDRLNVPTFCSNGACSSGSAIDQILFSNDLGASYVTDDDPRFEEVLDAFGSYTSTVSNHLPVVARFTLMPVAAEEGPEAAAALAVAPNPVRSEATARFTLAAPSEVRVDVVDVLGRRALRQSVVLGAGEHALPLNTRDLAPGLYVLRVEAGGEVTARTFVRAR